MAEQGIMYKYSKLGRTKIYIKFESIDKKFKSVIVNIRKIDSINHVRKTGKKTFTCDHCIYTEM